jgi:hypothetical protein
MFEHPLKRLAICVLSVFLTNTILQPLAEASVWDDRTSALRATADKPAFLNQLPPISKPALDFTPKANLNLSASLREVVAAIPLSHSLIQEIYDAKDSQNPPVVIVQDVHEERSSMREVELQQRLNSLVLW